MTKSLSSNVRSAADDESFKEHERELVPLCAEPSQIGSWWLTTCLRRDRVLALYMIAKYCPKAFKCSN